MMEKFETLLDKLHEEKFTLIEDFDQDENRIVMLKNRNIFCTLKLHHYIEFDVYTELTAGIYEIGELHTLSRKLLNLKKICLSFDAEEMNTTQRLYPENRRGKKTQTSGL